MSIQIIKQDNFIKINISENVHYYEYIRFLKKRDLYDKIYAHTVNYDRESNDDVICSKIIYFYCSNNSYYSISSNKGKTCINRKTIYDEKNSNTEDFGTGEKKINDFDKFFHISDETIFVYPEEKEYGLQNIRHGLYHGSTVDGISFNSKLYFEEL